MSVEQSTGHGILLTEEAAAQVLSLVASEPDQDLALRIAAVGGGCSGPQYQLMLDDETLESDIVEVVRGVKVITDPMSAPVLAGAVIDFINTPEQQGFAIDNPNVSGCGCDESGCGESSGGCGDGCGC